MPLTSSPRVDRRPVVAIIGSGSDAHVDLAAPLGRWLARRGTHLLTGGGGGVMSAACEAFTTVAPRMGLAIGIVPADAQDRSSPVDGYPNPWVELPILTHLHLSGQSGTETASRNHIVILSADIVVALPGAAGTASEVELAGRYGRPIVVWGPTADTAADVTATTLDDVTAFLDAHLPACTDLATTKGAADPGETDDERRRHRRIACPNLGMQAGFRLASGAVGRFRVAARNISLSGLAFVHPQPVAIGATCQLLLPAAGGAEAIGVSATVRHCRRVGLALNEIAVEFDEPLEKAVLDEILEQSGERR